MNIITIDYGTTYTFDEKEILDIDYDVNESGVIEIDRDGKVSVQPVKTTSTLKIDFDIDKGETLEKIVTMKNLVDANGQPSPADIYYDILNPATYVTGVINRNEYVEQYLNTEYAAGSRSLTFIV